MIERKMERKAPDGISHDERHAIVIANSKYTWESGWDALEGTLVDREILHKMFKDNHYTVHMIDDTVDVIKSVREVMDGIDRTTLKLMHVVYTGFIESRCLTVTLMTLSQGTAAIGTL